MLSIFPELLNYSFFGIFLVRISLAIFLIFIFKKIILKRNVFVEKLKTIGMPLPNFTFWTLPILTFISGACILVGLYTQAAALISSFVCMKLGVIDSTKNSVLGNSFLVYFSAFIISVSLLFLGAGAFAFDLPI